MPLGRMSVSLKDADGYKSSTDIYFSAPDGVTVADISAELLATLALLNNVTAGVITAADLSFGVDISGITPNAGTGSDISDVGALRFPLTGLSYHWSLAIPAIKESLKSGSKLNMTDGGAVDLLADTMEVNWVGAGLTAGFYSNPLGIQLAPIADSFLADRKHRKQRHRGSFAIGQ